MISHEEITPGYYWARSKDKWLNWDEPNTIIEPVKVTEVLGGFIVWALSGYNPEDINDWEFHSRLEVPEE